jgi:hypothetical protein
LIPVALEDGGGGAIIEAVFQELDDGAFRSPTLAAAALARQPFQLFGQVAGQPDREKCIHGSPSSFP